jgi:4-hydroxy-tetrahydrodipicolinate synthase
MASNRPFRGVLAPVLTPFKADLTPDLDAFSDHCQWLLQRGVDGLAVFGTTSEANSLGIDERMNLLDGLIERGIPPARLLPGTGTCALPDTVRLSTHAVRHGCAGVLMLPPFYYKTVDDEGLFASYSEVIQRVGNSALRVYLYHIPPVARVSISNELIGRLLSSYEGTVVGLKDSSGDWAHTESILKAYPSLATFCGSEVFLLKTLRHGGAGSITATANVNPAGIRAVFEHWQDADADEQQQRITAIREAIQARPVIPALKGMLAACYERPSWRTVRPPLRAITDAQLNPLLEELRALGFEMGRNHIAA